MDIEFNMPYTEDDFALARDEKELMAEATTAQHTVQVACSRDLTNGAFANGVISFKFQYGGHQWLDASKSFLRTQLKLGWATGAAAGAIVDDSKDVTGVGLAMNAVATLFQSCEFRVNGRVVSRVADHVAQVSTVHERLNRSRSWLESIGVSASLMDSSYDRRRKLTNNSVYAKDGFFKSCNASGYTTSDAKGDLTTGAITIEVCWQPPLGIFTQRELIPMGSACELVLVPYSDSAINVRAVDALRTFSGAGYDSTGASTTAGAYKLSVESMYLYNHVIDGRHVEDGDVFLDTIDISAQFDDHAVTTYKQHAFEIPASTSAVTVGFQDNQAGSTLGYSPSQLCIGGSADYFASAAVDKLELKCNRLGVQVGAQSLTQIDLDPDFTTGSQQALAMPYFQAMVEAENPESMGDWIRRGVIYHWPLSRDAKDMSTRAVVSCGFATTPTNGQVVLFSHARGRIKMSYKAGRCVDAQYIEG